MKKLAIATIVVAALAMVMSGAALWRTRDVSSANTTGSSDKPAAEVVAVPDTGDKGAFGAVKAVAEAKLKVKVVRTPSDTVAASKVISLNPAAGTKVPVGSEVEVTVSSGPP